MTDGKPNGTVFVLAGTAATGKSTIADRLIKEYGTKYPELEFIEGDRLHPKENVEKMARGVPLQDEDRWGWLECVAHEASKAAGRHPGHLCVVTCSSLKKKYRDFMRGLEPTTRFCFIFLYASKDEIFKRLSARENHFMKSNMMESQFNDLELPKSSEENDCCVINLDGKSYAEIEDDVLAKTSEYIPYK